jgi:hypothetical protein
MTGTLESEVKAIVIPSGNAKEDLRRAKRAINYNERSGLNVPYIISGVGPDINLALGYVNPKERALDFHPELYRYVLENTDGIVGLDILSVDSIGNILNTFPRETSGTYLLVSSPLHLKRFKKIIRTAKEKGKISRDLRIRGIPTWQPFGQIFYELVRIATGKTKRALKEI